MRQRLLFCMMGMAVLMLCMYYSLLNKNPGLIGGFITIIAVFITQIVNIAEDILQDMFKGDKTHPVKSPEPPVEATEATANPLLPLFVLGFLFLSPGLAMAHSRPSVAPSSTVINNTVVNPTAIVVTEKVQAGVMVDMPHLVRIYGDWYIGAQGGKDMVYTNMSKGWFGYAKISYEGTLWTMFKSKEAQEQD